MNSLLISGNFKKHFFFVMYNLKIPRVVIRNNSNLLYFSEREYRLQNIQLNWLIPVEN